MQTLREIATERNSTTIFPIPIDLFKPFFKIAEIFDKKRKREGVKDNGKKEKEKKEKPLDKMTAKELRELAMSTGSVQGVHGMNKAELIAAIKRGTRHCR